MLSISKLFRPTLASSWTRSFFHSSQLEVTLTQKPKTKLPFEELVFGRTFTDHMLEVEWNKLEGWSTPKISPYHSLTLEPSAMVFHYAMECFEGMKAYKGKNGEIRMFRPDMNMKRLQNSCKRLFLPSFDENELTECIKELLKIEDNWIPNKRGYSLYLRPTVIGTQQTLGVGPSQSALMFVICSPVGPYYKSGFDAVKLLADPSYVRAWPHGTGNYKIGANYSPGILPQVEAAEKGYSQILWLFGDDHQLTEVGTMNCFVFWINEHGEKELVTPMLDGTILPGVTRDSILQLTRSWGEFKVTESSKLTMADINKAVNEKRMLEMFGAGTACIVSPIKEIAFQGKSIAIPLDPENPNSQAGPLTTRLAQTIMDIQYGDLEHEWSVVVN